MYSEINTGVGSTEGVPPDGWTIINSRSKNEFLVEVSKIKVVLYTDTDYRSIQKLIN